MASQYYRDQLPAPYTQQPYLLPPGYNATSHTDQIRDPHKQPMLSVSSVGNQQQNSYPPQPQVASFHSPPTVPGAEQDPVHSDPHSSISPMHAHLASLPTFPLFTHHEAAAKQTWVNRYNGAKQAHVSSADLGKSAKLLDLYGHAAGAGGFSSIRHFTNGIAKVEELSAASAIKELATIELTRWALIGAETILVDTLEYKFKMNITEVRVKTNAKDTVKLAFLGKSGVSIKPGKMWKKAGFKHLGDVGIVYHGGDVRAMEVVARERMGCSGAEWGEMKQRFELGWHVPRV
ncbi:hypothetical protein H2198_003814 [Neophaeococcomyces mojaviensis]|uniref:Uncharacterized protein n=1 Tax=Neophaeococcomyces mojaviensis TaxID=3383035 RepID=A0ACC3AAL5_9EURO|nr:hypothetical protein H2198_003814 [Knufia sp. JES_112]